MSLKRDLDSLVYSDTEESPPVEPNKRQKKQPSTKGKRQPNVDPTYGQKWAFQVTDGLGVPSDDDLEFEDQTEALEYLRSVQKETKQIPHVVAAPKAGPQLPPEYASVDRTIYETGIGDSRGYYHDGAYTAAPDDYLSSDDEEDDLPSQPATTVSDPRQALEEAYFTSLTTRFTALRSLLHRTPPQSALDSLPPQHETEVDSFAPRKSSFRMWTHRIRYTDPLPAQLAAMDKVSVLRLLRVVLGGKFFRRGCELRRRTSRWIWALLARLPDRGQLDSDEIGTVRELGKRAVAVSIAREHVVALCEVLGREEVVGYGLGGVLVEIEKGEREREDGDEQGDDEDGGVRNEDEISLSPGSESREASQAQTNGNVPAAAAGVELEDGELPEELATAPTQPNDTNATAEADLDLEDGELPDDAESASNPQHGIAQADGTDEGELDMDIDSEEEDDMEAGEVSKEPPASASAPADPEQEAAAIAALKARLLQDLDKVETWEDRPPPSPPAGAKKKTDNDDVTDTENMRATVNMILTVAGEFYGQRDLLAFRDAFGGVLSESGDGDGGE